MSLKVDAFVTYERTDQVVIDVLFLKYANVLREKEHDKVGMEFFHKVQAVVRALRRDRSLRLNVTILRPDYDPSYTVHFTVICPKQKKNLLISKIKKEAKKQDLELGRIENKSIP